MNTKHDFVNILDIDSYENAIKKLWDMGISIVVLKSIDRNGYYTGYNGNIVFTEFFTSDYVDTTCSGDVFNGGFCMLTLMDLHLLRQQGLPQF